MKHFILLLSLFAASCGSDSGSSSSSSSTVSLVPQTNAQGELQASVEFSSGATISASALQLATNDPLSQFAKIEIPAGALSKNTEIKVFETGSLVVLAAPSDFGVTEVKKAGPALVIQGDNSALTSEITVSVPYSSASLNLADEKIAVLSLSSNTMNLYHGGQLIIGDKTVSVKVKHFGAFQVVKYSGVVQQEKATVQVSETSLKTVVVVEGKINSSVSAPTTTETAVQSTSTPLFYTSELDGKWNYYYQGKLCAEDIDSLGNPIYSTAYIEFKGTTLKVYGFTYRTSTCDETSLLYSELRTTEITKLGPKDSNGTIMDTVGISSVIIPANDQGIELLKRTTGLISLNNDWSRINWQINVPEFLKVGMDYTIYQLTNNRLELGSDEVEGHDGSSSDKRRAALDTVSYFLRVN